MRLFWLLCGIIALLLLVRVWELKDLYVDSELRSRVQSAVETVSEREGWLRSGISLQQIESDRVQVEYRSYLRGEDLRECYWLLLSSNELLLCDTPS